MFEYNKARSYGMFGYDKARSYGMFGYDKTRSYGMFGYDKARSYGMFGYDKARSYGMFEFDQARSYGMFEFDQARSYGMFLCDKAHHIVASMKFGSVAACGVQTGLSKTAAISARYRVGWLALGTDGLVQDSELRLWVQEFFKSLTERRR